MPGGDGTGPAGAGPMTGRAAGYCAGFNAPGYANSAPRLGLAYRRGYGGGRGGRPARVRAPAQPGAPPAQPQRAPAQRQEVLSRDQRIQALEDRLAALKDQLDRVENAIDQL